MALPWTAEVVLGLSVAATAAVGARRSSVQRLVALAGLAMALLLAPASQRMVLVTSLLAAAALRGDRGRVAPGLVLATLGLMHLSSSVALDHLLLALAVVGVGLTLVRRLDGHSEHGQAALGFALAACGGVLWCGMGGALDLTAAREGLADRATLPRVALAVPLPLILGGILIALLTPVRRTSPVTAAWLVTAPVLALVDVVQRLLLPLPQVLTLQHVPTVLLVMGGMLAVGSMAVALSREHPTDRLLATAPALVGLSWVGLSLVHDPLVTPVVGPWVRLAVPALLAAVVLAHGGGVRWFRCLGLTLLLWTLSGLPPLPGWRLRFELLERLLVGEAWVATGLLAVVFLLAVVVYMPPLVACWRETADDAETPSVDPLGRALAWLVVVLILIPGLNAW